MNEKKSSIPSGWKETTLGEVASTVTDYVANGSFASLKENVVYKRSKDFAALIRLADHNNGYSNLVFVDKNSYDFLKKSSLKYKDIIISNVGEYSGTVFRVPNLNMPMTLGPNSVLVRFDGCNDFFYYYLSSVYGQSLLNSIKSGSANPKFNKTDLKKLEFVIPEREAEQRAIAAVLSSLDDKIELLRSQNKTLENISQALFKRWFVEFEFPNEKGKPYKSSGGRMIDSELGKIPEGWRVGRLGDVVDLSIGRTPPRKESEWFSFDHKDVKWASIKDLGGADAYIFNTTEYLTREAIKEHGIQIVPVNTVLISFKLTVGRVALTLDEMATNEAIAHLKLTEGSMVSSEYLYLFFKNYDFNSIGSTSSIAVAFNSESLRRLEVLLPGKNTLGLFQKTIVANFNKIINNILQIQTLSRLRDAILPKLMKGEVRVKGI